MRGFHIQNFGCRAARADGEALETRLTALGLGAESVDEAALVVVNTCSVTAEADRDARAYIRKAHRTNPDARIIVTGCYAQRAPEELSELAGVSAVIGNSHKGQLAEFAVGLIEAEPAPLVPVASLLMPQTRLSAQTTVMVDDSFAHTFIEGTQVLPGSQARAQTRPNLKIQEGCANRCTFCVIPTTRGASRSLSPEKVLDQVRGFVEAGGKELVFSGINLGRWGRDLAPDSRSGNSFSGLVRQVFETTALPWLRLSSIEPMDWDGELIALMREYGGSRLCRHAHLPLQSGSDSVLRRMHRRYRPWHYIEKAEALLAAAGDDLALGADVMVGFPGETDAEFAETVALLERLPFAYLHLFPFSPRPGTRGWALHMENPVAPRVATARMAELRVLAESKTRKFRARFPGRSLAAITLRTSAVLAEQGRTMALTENFLPIDLSTETTLAANLLLSVHATGIAQTGELLAHL